MPLLWRLCICATLIIVAGCGRATDVDQGEIRANSSDEANQLPAGFGSLVVAATDDWMAGVGPPLEGSIRPESVVVVDLNNAEPKEISVPLYGGTPITIVDLVADGTTFAGIGYVCQGSSSSDECLGPQKLIRLDPTNGLWEVSDVPFRDGTVLGQMFSVGQDLLVIESDHGTLTAAWYDSSGQWSELAKIDTLQSPDACVTGTDLWLFTRTSDHSMNASVDDAEFDLTRVDLSSGETEGIDLPRLAGYFGGVTTKFGCGKIAPYLASTPAGNVPPLNSDTNKLKDELTGVAVSKWADRSWQHIDIMALRGHTLPDTIVSGPIPLLLGAEMDGTIDNRPISVLLDDHGGRQIAANGTDSYVWRGSTGDLIRIFERGAQQYFETESIGS